MTTHLSCKSSVDEIRRRFDTDVERFSNLDTGQVATIDAPLAMELVTRAAIAATPRIRRMLDLGCGAGNNTVRLLREYDTDFACDLCDLSQPMLERARERVSAETAKSIRIFHGDFRSMTWSDATYDVVIAAAVLHHLRDDHDWAEAFRKIYRILKPRGSFWITDLVTHENARIQELMWKRYADYLNASGGTEYRHKVLAYIDKEDSPRPLSYQLELMRRVGFQTTEILHKNSCFAAFGAIKGKENRRAAHG